jgi:predicted MPP superfamily phosphohydrolase
VLVRILGRLLLGNTALSLLAFVAASESLLVHFALLAARGSGLPWLAWPVVFALLAGANLAMLGVLRAARRRGILRFALRAWMVASLGALFSGPPLFLALIGSLVGAVLGASGAVEASVAAAGGSLGLGFGAALYGLVVGQRRVRVERVDLPIRDLPAPLAGLRIVQLSDLHVGLSMRAPKLRRMVERVNALEPDLIVITGDIFDYDPAYIEEGCLELAKLAARHGVFAILGNHDVYTGADAVAAGIAQLTSIRLLRDDFALAFADPSGARLWIAGIDDPGRDWTERDAEHPALERLAREMPREPARILLAHRPSWFAQAADLGFPVVLSGHTHGGQIAPPGPFRHWNVARLIAHWTRGRFELDGSVLYVNRGLGVVGPPVRLNCSREIALLRLVAKA